MYAYTYSYKKGGLGLALYKPYINYTWTVANNELINNGTSGTNATMYSGRALSFDSASSQSIAQTITIASTATSMLYTLNGVATYTETPFGLDTSSNGVYGNLIYFNATLTQSEQDAYASTPHTFLYKDNGVLASDSGLDTSKVVAWFPMTDTDGYVRDMVGYSENNIFTDSFDNNTTNFSYVGATWSVSDNSLSNNGGSSTCSNASISFVSGKYYRVKLDVTSYTSGSCSIGSVGGAHSFVEINSLTSIDTIIYINDNGTLYLGRNNFIGTLDNIIITELSGIYPITNYTTGMNLTGLPTGLQASKLLLDDNGVVLGKSDFLEFYGSEYVDTQFNPQAQTFTYELIVSINDVSVAEEFLLRREALYDGSLRLNSKYLYFYGVDARTRTNSQLSSDTYYYIAISSTDIASTFYLNSVIQSSIHINSYLNDRGILQLGKFNGKQRLFKVHNKVLTQEEITTNYNSYVAQGLLQ